jgi:hypothetical protein
VRRADVTALRHRVHAEVGVGIDEAGIHGLSLELPDASAGGRRDIGADGGNEPVADHDGGILEHLAGGRDHPRAGEGVKARAVVAQTRDGFGAGGLLRLEAAAQRHAGEQHSEAQK